MSYDTPSSAVSFKFAVVDQVAKKVENKYGATTLLLKEPSTSKGDTGAGALLVKVPVGLGSLSPARTFLITVSEVAL